MDQTKRKAEDSGRFQQLLKKLKGLEEEILLCIANPPASGDCQDDATSQQMADGVGDAESQTKDGSVRYFILSDDKENLPLDDKRGEEPTESQLDEEVLKVLGECPKNKAVELEFPSELTLRWEQWLKSGISKETKQDILDKYSRQGNIYLEAPELNQELLALLNDAAIKRDKHFLATQKLVGTALSSLGAAIVKVMFAEEQDTDRIALLEELSDTAKILTEVHHGQSKARIAYILPSVSKEFRAILDKTTPDKLLFGADLGEKIRDAKTVAKIGKDFKAEASSSKDHQKGPLNSKGLTSKPGNPRSGQSQKFSGKNSRFMNWTQKSPLKGRAQKSNQQKTNYRSDYRRSQ